MKREQLEKYLKEKVKIILFDGDELEGYLRKTGEELKKMLWGWTFAESIIFCINRIRKHRRTN